MSSDVIQWLLEDNNPAVKYRTMTEMLGESADKKPVIAWLIKSLPDDWAERKGLWSVYYLTAFAECGLSFEDLPLYAAHMIPMGAFEEWGWLREWVMSNDKYIHAWGEVRVTPHDKEMDWAMEEPLNFYNIVREQGSGADTQQLDLLFPIKPKFAATTKHPQETIVQKEEK